MVALEFTRFFAGRFLCRFDADDVMFEERIERQVEALRSLCLGLRCELGW